jgi:hypothetical protein
MKKPAPPLTPLQRKLRYGRAAEIALLRTTIMYGQTPDVRQDAMERLRELGVDPTDPGPAA